MATQDVSSLSNFDEQRFLRAPGSWDRSRIAGTGLSSPPQSSAFSIHSTRRRRAFMEWFRPEPWISKEIPPLPSTGLDQANELEHLERPKTSTAPVLDKEQPKRKKSQPLRLLRAFLFRGRKESIPSPPQDQLDARSFSPNGQLTDECPAPSREWSSFEVGHCHCRKQRPFSPPSKSQCISPIDRDEAPSTMEDFREQEAAGIFFPTPAYEEPERGALSINSDNARKRWRPMGVAREAGRSGLRPKSSTHLSHNHLAPPDGACEIVSVESKEISPDPDDAIDTLEFGPKKRPTKYPRPYASLGALNERQKTPMAQVPEIPRVYGTAASRGTETKSRPILLGVPTGSLKKSASLDITPEELRVAREKVLAYRANQPLPPLPPMPAKEGNKTPKHCLTLSGMGTISSVSLPSLNEKRKASPSKLSSARSTRRLPVAPASIGEMQRARIQSKSRRESWEDEIDFCYERAAESTCNFNWDNMSGADSQTLRCDENAARPYATESSRKAKSSSRAVASSFPSDKGGNPRLKKRSCDIGADGHPLQLEPQHKRASSIGHRGFLAARGSRDVQVKHAMRRPLIKDSSDSVPVTARSPPLGVAIVSNETSKTPGASETLRPVVSGADWASSDRKPQVNGSGLQPSDSSSRNSYESTASCSASNGTHNSECWSLGSQSSVIGSSFSSTATRSQVSHPKSTSS